MMTMYPCTEFDLQEPRGVALVVEAHRFRNCGDDLFDRAYGQDGIPRRRRCKVALAFTGAFLAKIRGEPERGTHAAE
jgi:hypothetical protein